MAALKSLEAIMNSEFKLAKRYYRMVALMQWLIALVAGYAIVADASGTAVVVMVAFLGPLLTLIVRDVGSHYYAKGERIRRLNLLQEGLGIAPSDTEMLQIFGQASNQKPDGAPLGGYYTSDAEKGTQRLWHLLQESAFWTEAQARFTMWVHYALAGVGLLGTMILVIIALRAAALQPGPTAIDYSRLFSVLVLFFVAGTTLTTARIYQALAKAANKVFEQASALRKEATANTVSDVGKITLYKILGAYDTALAKALPLPTYSYTLQQSRLNAAWTRVGELEGEARRSESQGANAPAESA